MPAGTKASAGNVPSITQWKFRKEDETKPLSLGERHYPGRRCTMNYVLVKVWKGIIDCVSFFDDETTAIQVLSDYVKTMNIEHCDAAVYGPDGMVANAKTFLDDDDRYCEQLL